MASNSEFQPVGSQAWLQGYRNLVRKENYFWWRTKRWWIQTLTWLVFTAGLLAMFVWVVPERTEVTDQTPLPPEVKCLMFFIRIMGLAPAIGVILLAQDTILNERLSGTMAWVLTKPVSRIAFLLSKLFAHALGILMTMVIFQGIVVYLLILIATGKPLFIPWFMAMSGVLWLNLLFFLTLTVLLSTISNNRGLAIGIPLLIIFGSFIFRGIAPWLVDVMPWNLTSEVGPARPALALVIALGQRMPTWMPVIATACWSLVFTGITIWRFQREEF